MKWSTFSFESRLPYSARDSGSEREMMIGEKRSVEQVKAAWALNEIRSLRTTRFYDDHRIPELLRTVGTSSSTALDTATSEFRLLLELFENARGRYLHMYFAGIKEFVLEQWSVERLCVINAMSQMDPLGKGRFISVLAFALSPPPVGTDAYDPRTAVAKVPLSDKPFQTDEPIVVGLYNSFQVLIDGYGRSILFMRSADRQSRIPVLVPS
jgi:hypothetical protein